MIKIIIISNILLQIFQQKRGFLAIPIPRYLNKLEANVGNVNDLLNIIEHMSTMQILLI